MAIIYLVRHGETDWNVEGRLQGHINIPLNDNGRNQAKSLKNSLRDTRFAAAFSSDLDRAYETATLITEGHVIQDARLRERHYGPFEGRYGREIDAAPLELRSQLESDEALCTRVLHFLEEVAKQHLGQNILVVSHGGVMKTLHRHLTGHPTQVRNTEVLRFSYQNGQFTKS